MKSIKQRSNHGTTRYMFNGNRDYCYNYQHYRNGIRQGVNYDI
jgi:hypothetical protein